VNINRRYNSSGKSSVRINEQIRVSSARIIDQDGNMLGVLNLNDALSKAEEVGLDLVEVAPNASPPVCKIIDYGKYKYELQKKLHDAKRNQKKSDTKEIKLRPSIDSGDYDVKLRNAKKFIADGNRVKVSMVFRGREITHHQVGMDIINAFKSDLSDVAKIDFAPKMEGKQIFMVVAPLKM
jgi:translation initiation factor IF-3